MKPNAIDRVCVTELGNLIAVSHDQNEGLLSKYKRYLIIFL